MPGAGTHTTIIQFLANLPGAASWLGDPTANTDWGTYESRDALQSRYAVLGAMGPDIFYAMLDYGGSLQELEDVVLKIAGTFECVGHVTGEVNNLINGTLDTITLDTWKSISATGGLLRGILVDSVLDFVVRQANFWHFFMPLRQVDAPRHKWYWADYLHYVKTGCFTQKLLDNCRAYQEDPANTQLQNPDNPDDPANQGYWTTKYLTAYSLGYLTHYVADTIGHGYVNRIVQSPWRNCWQRHHLVENFIDAYIWELWHDGGAEPTQPSADEQGLDVILSDPSAKTKAAPLHNARLNDLCNIGSEGIDPIIDSAVAAICESIQKGLFDFKLSKVPTLQPPDDPAFITWTKFIADAIVQTYPPNQVHPDNLASSTLVPTPDPEGYPSPEDIAAAYSAYRLVLSLATEDDMDQPQLPDVPGDLWKIIKQTWDNIVKDLSIPPPPPLPGSQGISLQGILDAVGNYVKWLGQVFDGVMKALGDLLLGLFEFGVAVTITEPLKILFYLLNSLLYSIYHSIRMTLVMSAYSVPFTEDLNGMWGSIDLRTLWNVTDDAELGKYPVEPVLSERDFTTDSAHPFAPYRPYFRPTDLSPVNTEFPPTALHKGVLDWTTPNDMLQAPLDPDSVSMFSPDGPAPPVTVPLLNPDGSKVADVATFDGSQRYFGGIFANSGRALSFAIAYLSEGDEGFNLPDYNLDSDRGFAWPCWDVDYSAPDPAAPYPWNGCDPFPTDSTKTDPWGNPRNGRAWIIAKALNAVGDCQFFYFPFPSIQIDPTSSEGDPDLDPCSISDLLNPASPTFPTTGLLPYDYKFAPAAFINASSPDDYVPPDPATGENDGRLIDFLRQHVGLTVPPPRPRAGKPDPLQVLANAVTLSLSMGTTVGPAPLPLPDPALVTAVAQLAVTGRQMYEEFAKLVPQDADLVSAVQFYNPGVTFPATMPDTAHSVLDEAYRAVWAIRANDPGWRSFRPQLCWMAASGFDDTPHRPVNVPTAPYPQYDIGFSVTPPDGGSPIPVTTRFMVASAHTFIGPSNPEQSVFVDPAPDILEAPSSGPFSDTPAPRSIPDDAPVFPPGNQIIIYVHGGGSRAEEAVDMANSLIVEGAGQGVDYTVVSFDLPNSAYAAPFDISQLVGSSYHPSEMHVLKFEQQYVIDFIEQLDQQFGAGIKDRIVAVMGGSLGGNTSLLLTGSYDPVSRPYLKTIVAWSATAVAPSTYLGIISQGDVGAFVAGLRAQATSDEAWGDHSTESQYINDMYYNPLLKGAPPLTPHIPAQPIMWYRGADDWQLCKSSSIACSRFDRYEIYSKMSRHWTTAIDLEQIFFSFQDFTLQGSSFQNPNNGFEILNSPPGAQPPPHLLLAAGDNDNFNPNAIYNSTIDLVRLIRRWARGKAEFWYDTGHSFHNERPNLFAQEVVYFLNNLDAGDSPHGVVVTTPQQADYSRTDQ